MNKHLLIFILPAFLLLNFCGKTAEDKPVEKPKTESEEKTGIKALDEFVDNLKNVQKSLEEGKKYEVVDFRDLRALLPESLGELKRTNAEGEKSGAMGFTISKATADYNTEDYSNRINIEITDLSGASGLGGWAAWGWAMTEIDKETEAGYEKTLNYKGHKAFEKFNTTNQNGSFEVLVSGRFMVSVSGYNVPAQLIKDAVGQVDISKLEEMREAGAISE